MKKIRFALTIIKIYMKNQMQDRTNILLDIFQMFARCFIVFLLYAYVFKVKGGTIGGADYVTTMWSMFIYFCVMILAIRRIDNIIMNEVKSGNVEMFMNKPVSYLSISIFKTLGQGVFSFVLISLVGAIVMTLTIGLPTVDLKVFIPTFIITFILGMILYVLIFGLIGVLSFFIQDIRPIHWLVDKCVMVLGGSYLPVSMFPGFLRVIAYVSPFGAVNFVTSTVFDTWNNEFLTRIILQLIWIGIFGVLLFIVYRKSKERSMVNGG